MTKKKMRDIIKASLFANPFCSEVNRLKGDKAEADSYEAMAFEAEYIAQATGLMTISECTDARIRAERSAKEHYEAVYTA